MRASCPHPRNLRRQMVSIVVSACRAPIDDGIRSYRSGLARSDESIRSNLPNLEATDANPVSGASRPGVAADQRRVVLNAVLEAIRLPPPPVMERISNATISKIAVIHCLQRLSDPTHGCFEMVEAGGVEPPSEKRYDPKTTCLARSVFFARHAQKEQETQPASPMNLARELRTETPKPAHSVTPLTGPVSKARGSVALI
jgi:hypothetical protein